MQLNTLGARCVPAMGPKAPHSPSSSSPIAEPRSFAKTLVVAIIMTAHLESQLRAEAKSVYILVNGKQRYTKTGHSHCI